MKLSHANLTCLLARDSIFQKIQVRPRAHNGIGKTPIPFNGLWIQFSGSRLRSCSNQPPVLESLFLLWLLCYSKEEGAGGGGRDVTIFLKSSFKQVSSGCCCCVRVKCCNKLGVIWFDLTFMISKGNENKVCSKCVNSSYKSKQSDCFCNNNIVCHKHFYWESIIVLWSLQ